MLVRNPVRNYKTYSTKSKSTFADMDECCVGGYCHDNATCTNTPGSYFCTCKPGFIGNNTHCEGIHHIMITV